MTNAAPQRMRPVQLRGSAQQGDLHPGKVTAKLPEALQCKLPPTAVAGGLCCWFKNAVTNDLYQWWFTERSFVVQQHIYELVNLNRSSLSSLHICINTM